MGKSTIFMAIFNSFLYVHQRVYWLLKNSTKMPNNLYIIYIITYIIPIYWLFIIYITMERSTIFNGKIHYKWPFSIAIRPKIAQHRSHPPSRSRRQRGSRGRLAVASLRRLGASELQQLGGGAHGAGRGGGGKRLGKPWENHRKMKVFLWDLYRIHGDLYIWKHCGFIYN